MTDKYKISSKVIKDKKLYFILRPNNTVVNHLYDANRDVIQAYLDRLAAMGYCIK